MILELQNHLNINSDCSNYHSLPDLKIKVLSRKSYISKELYLHEIILKPSDYLIEGNRIKNNFNGIDNEFLNLINEECQPAFMPIDVPPPRGPLFVFGEYFMKKFYTVFDRDENVVGLSLANHQTENENLDQIFTPYDDSLKNKNKIIPNIKETEEINTKKENNKEEIDFNLFMENFNKNNITIYDNSINSLKKINNESYDNSNKLDILDLDLVIGEEKNSNFLLNSETFKFTTEDINDVHLDLGLIENSYTE